MFTFIINSHGTSISTEISYSDNNSENEQNVKNMNMKIIRKKKQMRTAKKKGKHKLFKLL